MDAPTDFHFLPAPIREALEEQDITTPTAIQQSAIPAGLDGRDVLAQSETGSGKTLAFALPIGLRLDGPSEHGIPRALILAPTRELASQVAGVFRSTFKKQTPSLRICLITGGASFGRQKGALRQGVDVVVGTPGRVVDLMQQGLLSMEAMEAFVLDEVDQMLDIGFAEELNQVRALLPEGIQTYFFSATLSPSMEQLAQQFVREPVEIKLEHQASSPEQIEHYYLPVKEEMELPGLFNALLERAPSQALLFCRTRLECQEVADRLLERGLNAAPLHGDLTQAERSATLGRFRDGKLQYLVATNVAARGIDIQSLPLVINVDVPTDLESYTHRTGRTGRAGAEGQAWTIVTPRRFKRYRGYMKELGLPLRRREIPMRHEVLHEIAKREILKLFDEAEAEPPRSVRRVTEQVMQEMTGEEALLLVHGFLLRHLAQAQASDTRQISASDPELRGRFQKRHDKRRHKHHPKPRKGHRKPKPHFKKKKK